jgi:dsDNA-specific endonuclease/ATPase MutS2
MKRITIRKLRYEEARFKLEREIHDACMEGEQFIEILHGLGEGILKKMAIDYVRSQDFLKLVDRPDSVRINPGTTLVEIMIPKPGKSRW